LDEAQTIVSDALGTKPVADQYCEPLPPHLMTVQEAVAVWRNEGDPN